MVGTRQRAGSAEDLRKEGQLVTKVTAPPKPTNTPPPIVPNSNNASVEQRLEDAAYDDFVKIRRRQIAAKRGG